MNRDLAEGWLINRILYVLFLSIIASIPWLHGAELPWEIFLFSAFTVFIIGIYTAFSKNNLKHELLPIKIPLLCLLVWFCYNGMHLIPLPTELVLWLSPNIPLEHSGSISKTRALTISTSLSLIELARITCVISAFILCYVFAKRKSRQLTILKVIFYSSAVMALYSQLNYYTNGQYELIKAIPPFVSPWADTVTGSFSYKNQYAIYTAMATFIGFGLFAHALLKQHQDRAINSLSSFVRCVLLEKHSVKAILLCVMLISLAGANSRGGVLIFFVTAILLAGSYLGHAKRIVWAKKHAYITLSLTAVFTLIFVSSKSFERYEEAGLNNHGRGLSYQTAIAIWHDYPVFGTGPGSYSVIQHKYKSTGLGNTDMWKHAHNDYLELLSTQGVVGFLLLSVSVLMLLRKIFQEKFKQNRPILLGCQAAIVCLLLHSLIDFNFSSLVFGVYFFVLVAVSLRIIEDDNRYKGKRAS